MINYIALSIPIFMLLIGVEVLFARLEHRAYYRFNDSINDLSCGILQQIVGVFMQTILFAGYIFLYERLALLKISNQSVLAWTVLFFGVDFCYYWFHRMSHEMNAPWAAHIVHHQSEEFNLAVALRQGTFQSWFSWIFYLPLAIIGFPPMMFLTMSAFNTLYQFWIHTRAIDKLGPFEWVLNTPSHHRVHHGRNPKYLDRNHAGVLIIWDRLFGTFQAEDEEVVYGVTEPVQSWNPIWVNFHYWAKLLREVRRLPRFVDKIKFWFMPPGWRPQGMPPLPRHAEVTPDTVVKYDTTIPRGVQLYVVLHFLPMIGGTMLILNNAESWSPTITFGLAGFVVITLLTLGGILDNKPWAIKLEFVRLVIIAGTTLSYFSTHNSFGLIAAMTSALVLVFAVWLNNYRQSFRSTEATSTALNPS